MTRRQLLRLIGLSAGSAAMYQAMSSLGLAAESPFTGTPQLGEAPAGATVLVLGAGIAGMVAAFELRKIGYRVQVLEYAARAGGRNITFRGGTRYTELGGETQHCQFDPGLYINPGPWRIPHHHHGILGYCRQFGVPLENFVQVNHQALLHSPSAFDGKPQRYRTVKADYHGHVAELLAKATQGNRLDAPLSREDQEKLLESLRWWGALDKDFRYATNLGSSERRGFDQDPGASVTGMPLPSTPVGLKQMLDAGLWQSLPIGDLYEMQGTLLQPVGGMDRIADAFAQQLQGLIRFNAKVIDIHQDERGVRATYEDTTAPGSRETASADWCICTLPLSILSQVPMKVSRPMADAISAVPYAAAVKVGLQFKRRFWEEDEHIYGGISYTSQPIGNIGYPSTGYHASGKGVLLGGYLWGKDAARFTSMSPDERVREAVRQGRQLHPQYDQEFDNGVSMAWHRAPGAMGCFALWTEEMRNQHYADLCGRDGRIFLAGEHASYLPAWQEGAVTSAIHAMGTLHDVALAESDA